MILKKKGLFLMASNSVKVIVWCLVNVILLRIVERSVELNHVLAPLTAVQVNRVNIETIEALKGQTQMALHRPT